ncbi:ABC transporter permease [Amycolatopsis nigrescens]|uniref:ABC transporter permease n=1 Tax=Amycolatopsis nigrescens TaxID=381445 RepID=UPI000375CB66|nr:ABC transporter permease [Amycolatopsis nigrescens]
MHRTKAAGGGLGGAIRAEWTKFWSVRSTWWSLIAAAALTFAYVLPVAASVGIDPDEPMSAPGLLAGGTFYLAQFAVVALAAMFIASEYSTGSIRATLQWVPARSRMLLAKAAVLTPVLFVFGALTAGAATAIAIPLMRGNELPSSAAGLVWSFVATGGTFALTGLLSLGLGAALRSVAGSITVAFMVLLMTAMLAGSLGLMALLDYLPGMAGMNAIVGGGQPNPLSGGAVPYSTGAGLLIFAGWAAAALAIGNTVLRRRDA